MCKGGRLVWCVFGNVGGLEDVHGGFGCSSSGGGRGCALCSCGFMRMIWFCSLYSF